MHGTPPSVRPPRGLPGAAAQAQLEPAWHSWVRLLDIALEAAEDPAWGPVAVEPAPAADVGLVRDPEAPLLHGAVVRVNARRVRRLTRELLKAAAESGEGAASLAHLRSRRLDALRLVRASIAGDRAEVGRMAEAAEVAGEALAVVAHLASIPVLHACARQLRDDVSPVWMHGYCPTCGAWPTLAELRGLERNRRLRCGRCASDWPLPVLHCPFCGELRHDHLAALLPEGEEQTRRLDVCNTCKGYLKTFTGLRPMPLRSVAMTDLASVELDLAAQERGYERPARMAREIAVVVRDGSAATRQSAAARPS